jgi:hypothetical protein
MRAKEQIWNEKEKNIKTICKQKLEKMKKECSDTLKAKIAYFESQIEGNKS